MTAITNRTFLKAVFGDHYLKAFVTGFPDDPGSIPPDARAACWSGAEYGTTGSTILRNDAQNNFFVISTFHPDEEGRVRRRKAQFNTCHLLMIDDVGPKVNADELTVLYGLEPSYRLETSPGNEQWGLLLEVPERNAWRVTQVQDGMIRMGLAMDGKDPGMKGVTRYARLPDGANTKKRCIDLLGHPFRHRMLEWRPDRCFTLDQIADMFDIPLAMPLDRESAPIPLDDGDKVLAALHELGVVRGPIGGKPGAWNVICPWIHEHTGQEDSGSAYFQVGYTDGTGQAPYGGYACHHGHCDERTVADIREYLAENGYPELGRVAKASDFIDDEIEAETEKLDATPVRHDKQFSDGGGAGVEPEKLDATPVRRNKGLRFEPGQTSVLRLLSSEPKERRWLVTDPSDGSGLIPAGEVGALVATGGTGKSFALLQLGMSMASGGLWLGKYQTHAKRVLAYFAEDSDDELQRRAHAVADHMDGVFFEDDRAMDRKIFETFHAVSVVGRRAPLTMLQDGENVLTRAVQDVIDTIKALGGVDLVIIDPASRFRGGEENSNEGATAFIQACERITTETGAALIFAHHTKQGAGRNLESSRGATALVDGARFKLVMGSMSDEEAGKLKVSAEEAKRLVELVIPKASYSSKPASTWLRRGHGGVLTATTLQKGDAPTQRALDTRDYALMLVELLAQRAKRKEYPLNREKLVREYGGVDRGPLCITAARLKEVIDYGLDNGLLSCARANGPVFVGAGK